jgi:ATP-dependent Clp protease adapter protein ClpS
MTAMEPAKLELAVLIREALVRTPEELAARMVAAHRNGRSICLTLTEKEHQNKVEWNSLADEIEPGGETH